GALRLAALVAMSAAAGSMQLVRALDSSRIELQRFGDLFRAASRLGHAGEHKRAGGPPDAMRNTFRGGMDDISDDALETLAAAGLRAAGEYWLDEALQDVADAVGQVTGADVTAIRVADDDGRLPVRAVASRSEGRSAASLSLAGDALGAGLEEARGPDEVVRIAARASGAQAVKLWQVGADAGLELLASTGRPDALEAVQAEPALGQEQEPVRIEAVRDWTAVTLTVGHPPLGGLQLVFSPGASPTRPAGDPL